MPETATQLDVGCYVYGVVAADATVPGLQGLDGAAVDYVVHDDVAAAVSELALDRPPGRRAELMAHSAVLDALASAGPVIPVQFGSVLEDDQAVVQDLLAEGHDHFRSVLDQLRGLVQLNLRATYVEEQVLAEVVQANPVVAELRRRTRDLPAGTMHPDVVRLGEEVSRAMSHKREEDSALVLDTVLPLVESHAVRAGGGVDHLLDVALLVRQDAAAAVEEQLEILAEAAHERIRLRLVGPVPPYDFVEGGAWV